MDEIGNDYDKVSEKQNLQTQPKQPKNKKKVVKRRDNDSQGYQSNDSGIRMGGNAKREKYKSLRDKEQEEEDEILNNEMRDSVESPERFREIN